jgi:hypothetical protein
MANYSTHDLKLTDAVGLIGSGETRLPDFQRSYVWRENHRKALIESMQKGYPVGGLLLLRLNPASQAGSPFGEKLFEGVVATEETNSKKPEWLVLDGQQRLTTCFLAFSPSSASKKLFFIDLPKLFQVTNGLPNKEINFSDFLVSKPRPVHLETPLFNEDLLALPFISLGRGELRAKLHTYVTNLQIQPEKSEYATFVNVCLEGYLDNLFDYQFPCVVLPSTLDLEAVANVFTKLNTGGVSLSAFDLCVSNLFAKGENLRTRWDLAKQETGVSLLDKDGTSLLQTVALLDNKPVKKAALVKNIDKTAVAAYWDKSVAGFNQTATLLSISGFTSSKTLPYDTLGPALAAAIISSPSPANPPERNARQVKIERWILQTAFSQRYTEGSDAKKQEDFPQALAWFAKNVEPAFLETVLWSDKIHHFPNTGARFKAFLAVLNKRGPHDLVQPAISLGLDNNAQQAQIHHIFPKAWLRSQDPNIDAKSIDRALNMTFLTAESNNYISDTPPSVYLSKLVADWSSIFPGLTEDDRWAKLKEILREHLVDEAAFDALMADNYEAFLKARGERLKEVLVGSGVSIAVLASSEDDTEEDLEDDQAE